MLPHEKQLVEYMKTMERLKSHKDSALFESEIQTLEQKFAAMQAKVYSELTPWERVQISRHPKRPQTTDYIANICEKFTELSGDRHFGDDHAMVVGLAKIGPMRCVLIGQEKGNDTDSRLHRNFGMVSPEGFRKSLRVMRLAEKFHLPVVCLMDTPGAAAVLEAEQRGVSWAIAENLREMAALKTPIIILIIGEGCSGGALGIGVGDVIGMLEHSYYTVISPESGASILWKDPSRKADAAASMKLNAENLIALDIVDNILKEPLGGAHTDPQATCATVKQFILEQWKLLKDLDLDTLLERRYMKFRHIGAFREPTTEG